MQVLYKIRLSNILCKIWASNFHTEWVNSGIILSLNIQRFTWIIQMFVKTKCQMSLCTEGKKVVLSRSPCLQYVSNIVIVNHQSYTNSNNQVKNKVLTCKTWEHLSVFSVLQMFQFHSFSLFIKNLLPLALFISSVGVVKDIYS